MKKRIATWIFGMMAWQVIPMSISNRPKSSVICIAPHTSNWDFILGKLFSWIEGYSSYFLIKKSWFFFPIGRILSKMGGIPIDRSQKLSTVSKIKELIGAKKDVNIAITPEGTRKKVSKWHRGFYYIALETGIPIQLAVIDYKQKKIGITEVFYPTGNIDEDLAYIQSRYTKDQAKYPEQFRSQDE